MNNDRLMGMMWGILIGSSGIAAIYIHPLMVLFCLFAFYFNYSFSVK